MRDHKQALSHRDGAAGAEQLDWDQLGDDDDDGGEDDEQDEYKGGRGGVEDETDSFPWTAPLLRRVLFDLSLNLREEQVTTSWFWFWFCR